MGGLCGRAIGVVGPFDGTIFGGSGGLCVSSTGDSVSVFAITYSASSGRGGTGGLDFAGGDVGGKFSDGDRDGKLDLGGGGGGVSGNMNFSNIGTVLSVKLAPFVKPTPSGFSL